MLGLKLFIDGFIKIYQDKTGKLFIDARDLVKPEEGYFDYLQELSSLIEEMVWKKGDKPETHFRVNCEAAISLDLALSFYEDWKQDELGNYLLFVKEQISKGQTERLTDFQAREIKRLYEKQVELENLVIELNKRLSSFPPPKTV